MTTLFTFDDKQVTLKLQVWVNYKNGTDKPFYGKFATVTKNELVIYPLDGGRGIIIDMEEVDYITTDYYIDREG